jgi:hypothetical protein
MPGQERLNTGRPAAEQGQPDLPDQGLSREMVLLDFWTSCCRRELRLADLIGAHRQAMCPRSSGCRVFIPRLGARAARSRLAQCGREATQHQGLPWADLDARLLVMCDVGISSEAGARLVGCNWLHVATGGIARYTPGQVGETGYHRVDALDKGADAGVVGVSGGRPEGSLSSPRAVMTGS